MRRCLTCGETFSASQMRTPCLACGVAPVLIDGFPAFAPDLARQGKSFKPGIFGELAKREEKNFWFQYRNRLILWALQTYRPDYRSFFELGCGTGFVLLGIAGQNRDATLSGADVFVAGLAFASQRLPGVELLQMDGRHIPYVAEFDALGAFDVLEHIDEDESVIAQIHAALKPNGTVLITVPQHAWLWSSFDEYACHVRRYSARDLHQKLERAGFAIQMSTSFVSALLPAMFASRLIKRNKKTSDADATSELELTPWLNTVLGWICSVEFALLRVGIRLPVGGSRMVVARKVR